MRKLLLLAATTSMLVFSSCNKNKKFNKTLEGTWVVTMQDGQVVTSDDATKFMFVKDGSADGDVTIIGYEDGVQNSQGTGTYEISDGGETLVIDATGTTSGSNPQPFTYHSTGKISNQTDTKFTYNGAITISSSALGGLGITENAVIEMSKQ